MNENQPAPSMPNMTASSEAGSRPGDPPQALMTASDDTSPAPPDIDAALDERWLLVVGRVDRVLIGLTLVLAFLLGAFAVHNSDVFVHLAAGRALAQGEYTFGVDPFADNTADTYWVHHSWLFDWFLYFLYDVSGGSGLVVFRGCLILGLAVVLLQLRRPGHRPWLAVVCLILTLLAVSTRVPMQSICVSYLFLALTLFILFAPPRADAPSSRRYWLLPPLFALWVNLDGWFILGPLTILLVLLGDGLQHLLDRGSTGRFPGLVWVFGAGLVACLVNPHLHRVFEAPLEPAYLLVQVSDALPAQLVASGTALKNLIRHDAQPAVMMSPFARVYWSEPAFGQNVAGLAYFPLLLLALFSFVLSLGQRNRSGQPSAALAALLVWVVFAALSSYGARLIPFFAIVSGAFAVLNLEDMFHDQAVALAPIERRRRLLLLGGRLVTLVACVILLYLAWPGWLHAGPDDSRRSHRVRFALQADPDFAGAAARLEQLRKTGQLKHGCHFTSDAGNFLAWLGKGKTKSLFDVRLSMFAENTAVAAQIRQELLEEADRYFRPRGRGEEQVKLASVQETFRRRGMNYLILTNIPFDRQVQHIARRLWVDPYQWPPLYADGRTVIFGWRDPLLPADPFAHERFSFDAQAFGFVPLGERAPPKGPDLPKPRSFGDRYFWGNEPRSAAFYEVGQCFDHFRLLAGSWREAHWRAWQATAWLGPAAATAVTPAELSGSLALAVTDYGRTPLQWKDPHGRVVHDFLAQPVDQGPPAAAILGVRSARRAVANHPNEAESYLLLAEGYGILWRHQEDYWSKRNVAPGLFSLLTRPTLRHVQQVTALQHALTLQPNHPRVHAMLAESFKEMNYFDVALAHFEQARKNAGALSRAGDSDKARQQFVEHLDKQIQSLDAEVKFRKQLYDKYAAKQTSALAKVHLAVVATIKVKGPQGKDIAVRLGLAQVALDLLRDTDLKDVADKEKPQYLSLQLALQLTTGQVREWRELEPKARLGLEAILGTTYSLFEALAAAALGDYAAADQALEAQENERRGPHHLAVLVRLEKAMLAELAWNQLGWLPSMPLGSLLSTGAFPPLHLQSVLDQRLKETAHMLSEAAETRHLRGLLALEQGDTERALAHFRECVERLGNRVSFGDRAVAERYLELLRRK
jgi:tetratricopeptide (TPR) repeat protein